MSSSRIGRVLIANRGEIACRIERTLRARGVESIAVYSEADVAAPHVLNADYAVGIGPAIATESYLDAQKIVDAAVHAGADAIHPGYGFLAENADFAAATEEAGLVFVGPTPDNLRQFGDKRAARQALLKVGLPPVPGHENVCDSASLQAAARHCGFPLLLKAAAGGGGRGIRIVREPHELESAWEAARREAKAAFGADEIIAERYLEGARHVEVQVLGDGRGGVRVFVERDCSTQRRLQKLVEETPSPGLTARQREPLLCGVAQAMSDARYRSAGTLEFLLTSQGELYFLEMNTRIQVEHPITEMVTSMDLVGEQLEVAAGGEYPRWAGSLDTVLAPWNGAAVEFRVNAEDPLRDFLPSTGRISALMLPGGSDVRVDAGVVAGDEVSPYYDPLLAKISAWGADRTTALNRLRSALSETFVGGVVTTLPLGLALLGNAEFLAAGNHCQWLESQLAAGELGPGSPDSDQLPLLAAAAAWLYDRKHARQRHTPHSGTELSPWLRVFDHRLGDVNVGDGALDTP